MEIKFIDKGRLNNTEMNFIRGGNSCDDKYKICGQSTRNKCTGGYESTSGNTLCGSRYKW